MLGESTDKYGYEVYDDQEIALQGSMHVDECDLNAYAVQTGTSI
jgi:hypothetical protein